MFFVIFIKSGVIWYLFLLLLGGVIVIIVMVGLLLRKYENSVKLLWFFEVSVLKVLICLG